MTEGLVKTKGTRLYFALSPSEILRVSCPTAITGLSGAATEISTTCLDSEVDEALDGLETPGAISVPFNFITQSAAHQALIQLGSQGERLTVPWMIVLSTQPAGPTALDSNGDLVSPGPTTVRFRGWISDLLLPEANTNNVVLGTLTIRRTTLRVWNLPAVVLA